MSDLFSHDGPIEGIGDFTELNGEYYFSYTALTENMVFYPDIERSRKHSTFYKLNSSTLELKPVTDEKTRFQLFNQTDFRTKFNPIFDDQWIYDPYDYSEPDSIEEKVVHLFSPANSKLEGDTIKFLRREEKFKVHTQGFLSEGESQRGVYFCDSDVNGDFLKLFFLEVENEKIISSEKAIKYSDLGFNAQSIELCQSYDFENNGKIGNEIFTTFYFNLDNDDRLGISTIFFDLRNFEYRIVSSEIKDKIPFIPDFSEIGTETIIDNEEVYLLINIRRRKIYQGERTNTPYNVGSSKDLIVHQVGSDTVQTQFIRNAKQNLELIFKTQNGYILIYDGRSEIQDLLEGEILQDRGSWKLSIVQIENGQKYIHEFPMFKYGSIEKQISTTSFYSLDNEDTSDGIDFCVYYSGEYYSGITDYRMQMIHLDL